MAEQDEWKYSNAQSEPEKSTYDREVDLTKVEKPKHKFPEGEGVKVPTIIPGKKLPDSGFVAEVKQVGQKFEYRVKDKDGKYVGNGKWYAEEVVSFK